MELVLMLSWFKFVYFHLVLSASSVVSVWMRSVMDGEWCLSGPVWWSVTWNCQSPGYPRDHQLSQFLKQYRAALDWRKKIFGKNPTTTNIWVWRGTNKWSDNWWIKYVNLFACLELMEEIDFTIFGQRPKPSVSVMGHINSVNINIRGQYVRSNLLLVYQNIWCELVIFTRSGVWANKEILMLGDWVGQISPDKARGVWRGLVVVPEYFIIPQIFSIKTKYFTWKTFTRTGGNPREVRSDFTSEWMIECWRFAGSSGIFCLISILSRDKWVNTVLEPQLFCKLTPR